MMRIELTITALSPLAIGQKKPGGSVSEAQNYIPGSVIRGAIAAQILQQANQKGSDLSQNENDFQSLFLGENSAIFQNAYPAIAKIGKEEFKYVTDEVRVLPVTAISSKTESGFKPSGNGVFDTLIDHFCAERYNHPFDPSDPKSLHDGTDARVEAYTGFYSKTSDSKVKHQYRSHSVSTRFLTRVGINRRRATSEDDILYSIEVLNESYINNLKPKIGEVKEWQSYVYRSLIVVNNDNLAQLLAQFINNIDSFRLGGSASRGLGKVKIEVNSPEDPKLQVREQIQQFNHKLRERWKDWKIFNQNQPELFKNRFYFTLNLQSDAILTDNWRYTTVISEEMLKSYTNIQDDSSLKLETSYSSYDYCAGWNSAWGLMKDVELVTNKGAVYLFSTTEDKMNNWIEALEKLEMSGIGDRTYEGFGQVEVCNEFHLVFREKAV